MPGAGEPRLARFCELDRLDLYRILRLRAEVFAVEQQCAYLDPDGRDIEDTTVHVWFDPDPDAPTVGAALRLLAEGDGSRKVGRVVTAARLRGQGLGGRLLDRALLAVPAGAVVRLDAQVRLEPWYGRWGFSRCGPDFWEDGIAHVPMVREQL